MSELPSLELRPYRPDDLEDCMALWKNATLAGHPFLSAEDIDADEPIVRDTYMPIAEITVAVHRQRVVGFIAMVGDYIGALFIAPDCHRLGIGRTLVRSEAEKRNQMTVEVYEENANARAFYRALGFAEDYRRDKDDRGRPHPLVGMQINLAFDQ